MHLVGKNLIESIIIHEVLKEAAPAKVKKHMQHVYENSDMKFSEIVDIFQKASSGTLENVKEKLDGQNVSFTYNVQEGKLKFGRNQTHVKTGGIDAADIESKWADLPNVKNAFLESYNALNSVVSKFGKKALTSIFGPNGNRWYSTEILYSGNPNVLKYGINRLVLHKVAVERNDATGEIANFNDSPEFPAKFELLNRAVDLVNKSKKPTGGNNWQVSGPVMANLKAAVNDDAARAATQKLSAEMSKYALGPENTIGEYLTAAFAKMIRPKVGSDGEAYRLGQIFSSDMANGQKKKAALEVNPSVATTFFKADGLDAIKNRLIAPIEKIIHDFAVEILKGVHSALIANPDEEIQRLKDTVAAQIKQIQASGNEKHMEVLKKSMSKLKSVDNITSAMEGITFEYGGRLFKLTGNFSPINQILGLLRF